MSTQISLSNLHQKQLIRQNNQLKIFDQILDKCYKRINLVAYKSNEISCFFLLPEFVFGIPLYNAVDCAKYIIKNLMKEGFMVVYTHPNLLYISWDIKYTKAKNNAELIPQQSLTKLQKNEYKSVLDYKPKTNIFS